MFFFICCYMYYNQWYLPYDRVSIQKNLKNMHLNIKFEITRNVEILLKKSAENIILKKKDGMPHTAMLRDGDYIALLFA